MERMGLIRACLLANGPGRRPQTAPQHRPRHSARRSGKDHRSDEAVACSVDIRDKPDGTTVRFVLLVDA